MVSLSNASLLLVVDLIDEDTGLAEVEDDQGRTYAFPAAWLPEVADGQAYRAVVSESGLTFVAEAGGAALLREKSKQTLLDFSDDFSAENPDAEDSTVPSERP
ncbi:hypothetical protein FNU79_10220 [Deinococcus detaillensis]|uniref:DUF3006 domain-containing protein n=1 Tax=Deinococcus detaillensis TaxID=2592048 RepID=A0A553UWM1_9DEIO|nr:hypothetical protein [Deinococcus detaillensis]TSA84604.1 hypothetical protein FNU79_10220 [Deinococcus detaillensis]